MLHQKIYLIQKLNTLTVVNNLYSLTVKRFLLRDINFEYYKNKKWSKSNIISTCIWTIFSAKRHIFFLPNDIFGSIKKKRRRRSFFFSEKPSPQFLIPHNVSNPSMIRMSSFDVEFFSSGITTYCTHHPRQPERCMYKSQG